jgi:ferredoxin
MPGRPRHLVVDPISCDGHGICAELLPEMIQLDDWGYPIVNPDDIPRHLLPHARRAVAACPTIALRLAVTATRGPGSVTRKS